LYLPPYWLSKTFYFSKNSRESVYKKEDKKSPIDPFCQSGFKTYRGIPDSLLKYLGKYRTFKSWQLQ